MTPLPSASEAVSDGGQPFRPAWLRFFDLMRRNVSREPLIVDRLPDPVKTGAGEGRFVTDATSTTFGSVVAGGGSNGVPVYCDGTDWRIG